MAEAAEVVAVELAAFVEGVAPGVVEALREVVDVAVALGAGEGHRTGFCNLNRALLVCCHYACNIFHLNDLYGGF